MATMNLWPVSDHELVHTAAHERVHTQFEALPHADVFCHEAVAFSQGLVLSVSAIAVFLVRVAYRRGNFIHCLHARLFRGTAQA